MDVRFHCTGCDKDYPSDRIDPRCENCNEPLQLSSVEIRSIQTTESISVNVWDRYRDFFPFALSSERVFLGEGLTPLTSSPSLAQQLGVRSLNFKNETFNPTWSFKDRGTAAGVHHAIHLGHNRIGTVSTGNMAASVAAFGARAGLETIILVSDSMPEEKLAPIAIYNPRLIRVHGDYGKLYFESLRLGSQLGIYFINSDVPLRVEGSKTIAFEICEQMNFTVPDWVIIPTSAGGNFRGIVKGFREFHQQDLIDRMPKFVCAQAEGCCPITRAFESGLKDIERFAAPSTIAHAIENPFPPSGNEVLRLIRTNGGTCVAVSDEDILAAQRLLARQGIFGQPASAVPLAALKRLQEQGVTQTGDRIVCLVSGSGLKSTSTLKQQPLNIQETDIETLESALL